MYTLPNEKYRYFCMQDHDYLWPLFFIAMAWQKEIQIAAHRRGIHLITHLVENELPRLPQTGILQVFIKHSSAGLSLNENADPTVRIDMEVFFDRLVPERQSWYRHTLEGDDDMPAHIKSSLVGSSLMIPISHGRLNLGTWQGIYLCEFRNHGGPRKIVLTLLS